MSNRRYAAKVDSNQQTIIDALAKIPGVSVAPGHDDILVGYRGRTHWIEIKHPDRFTKDGKLHHRNSKTGRKQKKLGENWTGSYHIVSNIDEILHIIMGVKIDNV